jgi:tripartite-type tricarboxylate transporter receptor subunit TctC
LPDVPTIDEGGVAGYEATSWNALLAPGATPRDLVLKIQAALADSLRAARVKEILVSAGADAAGGTPEELAGFLRTEMVKWGKVVKAADIKPE